MRKKWEPQNNVVMPHVISSSEYKQLLAELTVILYREFCQLNQSEAFSAAPVQTQRTGTNG
ncbi:MAG: hypothetical protein AB7F59_09450 [Bdellovibrionales bacterium]